MNRNINAPNTLNVQVDLSSATGVACEKCGNDIFQQGYYVKRLSEILSPTGKEMIIPVQILQCTSCGNVNKEFRLQEELADEKEG